MRAERITKSWIARFEKELTANETRELRTDEHPGIRQVVHDALTSEIETLRRQVDHYDKLRDGQITSREISSLRELPIALIEACIAARLTQRQLAQRIGVAEQQIQRWEANEYSGVGLDRLQSIADALGMQIRETITYSSVA